MDIYITNYNFDILDTVVTYDSVIWNSKFHEPGTFEATFPFSERMNRHLKRGNFLYKTDEAEDAIITYKKLSTNKYGEETIIIRGYMSSHLISRRIIWEKLNLEGTPEEVMRKIVESQVISPKITQRKIPGIELGKLMGYKGSISRQVTYDNALDTLTSISKTTEVGFRLRSDPKNRVRLFECYKGSDRTFGTEQPCVFQRKYRNVLTQTYEENEKNYKNVCLVGGSGEDEARVLEVVGDASGIDRREVFSNSAGTSPKDISEAEYHKQLAQKGEEKLAKMCITKNFDSQINTKKKISYELGDYVTCKDDKWGISQNTQIKGIEKGYSKEEKKIYLTFGEEDPTLVQLIKNDKD